MKNDLSQSSVAVYTERRKNKSIWMRSCVIIALVVVMLTSYALIFPARTVEKELVCRLPEHVHDESCWLSVPVCGLEEDESHRHTADCYRSVLVCGMEEHRHGDGCYADPEPIATPAPTEENVPVTMESEAIQLPTEPRETELPTEPVQTEPEESAEPTEPVEPGEDEPPVVTEPDPVPGETEIPGENGETPRPVTLRPGEGDEAYQVHEFPEEGIDLAPYLESVVFQRQEGGVLVDDTVFANGESAKASIVYDIPSGVVTPESRYVFYQLPEGICPIEETSGEVMDEGVAVGVYTITEDGVIHILFNEDFANGNAIVGTVEFTSWLYANEDGTDRVVEFENNAGTITIYVPDEQKYDLQLEKTGAFSQDYSTAEYTLVVSSEQGTGTPIEVLDVLTNQTPATLFSAVYQQSVTVRRVAADGSETLLTDLDCQFDEDGMRFVLRDLPALEAGERYEISYRVDLEPDLSGSFELDNEAAAQAGSLEAETSFFISYVCDVTKSGSFNPVTGLIDWVITVNPESRPVAGWRIEDDLPYPAVGKVLLTNANGVRYADLTPADGRTIRYTFPPNAPARPYFIRYSTAAPTTSETVRNEVRLYNERETTVISEVEVDERSEGADKTVGTRQTEPDGTVRTNWSFRVTLPVGELESYSFRDNISTPIMNVNTGDFLDSNLHYSTAAALENAFRGNLRLVSDGVSCYYGDEANEYVDFRLTYYSASGSVVEPDDESTHVSRVVFELIPKQGQTFHGYEVVAEDYPTWLDVSQAREGDSWSYENYIYLRSGLYDEARAFYRKGSAFQKQLLMGSRYSSDDGYLDYSDCGGVLEYRLLLDLTALQGDSFSVTDLLPAGTELLPDSPRAYFTTANLHGEYAGSFSTPGNFAWSIAPNLEGGGTLRLEGAGVSEIMKQTYAYVGIVYQVRLTDESLWNDYTHSVMDVTNTASWEGWTDSHTVRVENQPKRLEKNGVQLTDSEGAPIGRIRFTLLINAAAEDLDPESDWITLSDRLSSGIGSDLELSSVSLYHYDPNQPDCLGNLVLPYEYHLSYDTEERQINVRLPDETAYVMLYDYTVDNTAILDGQTVIGNAATLAGLFHSETEIVLKSVNSSATAWQRVVTVTKVDSENYAKVLPGAVFTLEVWDPDNARWSPVTDAQGLPRVYVSDESGKIILSMLGEDHDLETSRLYRLTEVRAPAGYEISNGVVWFLCLPRGEVDSEPILAEAGAGSGVEPEDVNVFNWNGGSCIVTNPFNGLTVEKRWFRADGTEITDPDPDRISVTLYQTTDPSGETGMTRVVPTDSIPNPVSFGAEEEWSYTWDKLPGTDEAGNPLYYFVAEDPVPGFEPVYINNGIPGGTIVISNNCEPYELPATGSVGSRQFVGLGMLLMLMAAVACIKFKKMEEKQ